MDTTEQQECLIQGRNCFKIVWNRIAVGLVSKIDDRWHFTKDMKGEFWSLHSFDEKEAAVKQLVEDRKNLDDYRINFLSDNSNF